MDGTRATGVEVLDPKGRRRNGQRRRGDPVRRRVQLAAAAAAVRASAMPSTCASVGVDPVHHLPGRGREPAGPPRGVRPALQQAAGLAEPQPEALAAPVHRRRVAVPALGPGASNHFEGGGFARSNDDVDYPNLMFHFLPIAVRYDGTAPAGAMGTRCTSGPCTPTLAARCGSPAPTRSQAPAIRQNYLSTEQDRREWVEAIKVAREHPRPAGLRPVQRRGDLARTRGRLRRGHPRVGPPRRRDGLPPVLHLPDGHRRDVCRRSPDDAGARHGGPARRGRVRHALHHQREPLRARR